MAILSVITLSVLHYTNQLETINQLTFHPQAFLGRESNQWTFFRETWLVVRTGFHPHWAAKHERCGKTLKQQKLQLKSWHLTVEFLLQLHWNISLYLLCNRLVSLWQMLFWSNIRGCSVFRLFVYGAPMLSLGVIFLKNNTLFYTCLLAGNVLR